MTRYIRTLAIAVMAILLISQSCDEAERTARLQIHLTDAPAEIQQVNIDVEQVRLKMASDTNSFIDLATNAGIYDLLQLQNGVDTLLVDDVIPVGTIKEIRLILGYDNTVMEDSVLIPLQTPSGHSSGYKIKLDEPVSSDEIETIVIDFDAGESVNTHPSGGYVLLPVLKIGE